MKNQPSKQLGAARAYDCHTSQGCSAAGAGVLVQPKQAPIHSELRTNAELRDELHDRIKRLHEQLGTVMAPPSPEAVACENPVPSPGVLGEIEYSNRSLRTAIDSLNDMSSRLLV